MNVDDVAEAMYGTRPRQIKWEDLSEVGWKAEYRKMAQAAIVVMGLTPEYRTGEDGSGGMSTNYKTGETTTSGRSPTVERRWVTGWEVFKKAQDYSHTSAPPEPEKWPGHSG